MLARLKPKPSKTRAPSHLKPATKRWFLHVLEEYELEEHHRMTLQTAAECWDRAAACRKIIDVDGEAVRTRLGDVKAHPLLAAERDARTGFLRALRELDLDITGSGEAGRPPLLRSNRRFGIA